MLLIHFIDKLRILLRVSFNGTQTAVDYAHHLTLKDIIVADWIVIEIFLNIGLQLAIELEIMLI